ncbi:hypothetical protein [Limnobacter sp.]|uniref:hypothetical protein n=1 Tax=Limnobacter sp. TaxID=2003368 RepID=UPI00374A685E
MAHLEQRTTTLSNPVSGTTPIQLLQVFNSGKPCGWLGHASNGFWFHYSSNSPQQQWVSLLMPPSTNFYQQAELFPVFAQHASLHADHLTQLQQLNGQQLGSLSFANPDNPVVKPPLRTPPPLTPGQRALIAIQGRKPFADTLVHHASCWPLIQTLQHIKKQADPNNRLQGLRWALRAQHIGEWVQHPRPDMDNYLQQLYGLEAVHAVLNLNQQQFTALAENRTKFVQVLHEVARTYCKNFIAEIELLQHLQPFIAQGQLQACLVYQQRPARVSQPLVLGFEYIPI